MIGSGQCSPKLLERMHKAHKVQEDRVGIAVEVDKDAPEVQLVGVVQAYSESMKLRLVLALCWCLIQ